MPVPEADDVEPEEDEALEAARAEAAEDAEQSETPTFPLEQQLQDEGRYIYDAEGHRICFHCGDPLCNFDLDNNEDGVCFGCFYDEDHR